MEDIIKKNKKGIVLYLCKTSRKVDMYISGVTPILQRLILSGKPILNNHRALYQSINDKPPGWNYMNKATAETVTSCLKPLFSSTKSIDKISFISSIINQKISRDCDVIQFSDWILLRNPVDRVYNSPNVGTPIFLKHIPGVNIGNRDKISGYDTLLIWQSLLAILNETPPENINFDAYLIVAEQYFIERWLRGDIKPFICNAGGVQHTMLLY